MLDARCRTRTVRVAPVTEKVGARAGAGFAALDRMLLDRSLEVRVERIVSDAVVRLGTARRKVSRIGIEARDVGWRRAG